MLPFESLTISRYRGLQGLALAGFGRVNVLVGTNNSGKTSVLEALELMCDPMDPMRWIAVADSRDIRSNSADRVDNLLWMFPQQPVEGLPGLIEVRANGGNPTATMHAEMGLAQATAEPWRAARRALAEAARSVGAKDPPAYDEEDDLAGGATRRAIDVDVTGTRVAGGVDRTQLRVVEGERFSARQRDSAVPCTAVVSVAPLSHRNRSVHADRLSHAKEAGLEGEAVESMRQFDADVLDIDIFARQGTFADLRIKHRRLGLAPLNAFGDGMRRALLYALTVPQVRGGVLLIDEIESAIHVKALGRIFEWLVRACAQFDVQLFASTHSLEALDGLLGPEDGDVSAVVGYHLPSQPASGEVTRYDGDLLRRLVRERGLDVR